MGNSMIMRACCMCVSTSSSSVVMHVSVDGREQAMSASLINNDDKFSLRGFLTFFISTEQPRAAPRNKSRQVFLFLSPFFPARSPATPATATTAAPTVR